MSRTVRVIPAARLRTAQEDVMLDQMAFDHLYSVLRNRSQAGRVKGYLEAVYEANPDLAREGMVLPLGQLVELPEFRVTHSDLTGVRLWDEEAQA